MLVLFDIFGLSKITSAKCIPLGPLYIKVTLFSMKLNAVNDVYNQGIKSRISISKVVQIELNFRF